MSAARLLLAGFLCALFVAPPAWAAEGWRWPVRGPVLSGFRLGPDPFAPGQRRGIRIGARLGAPVRSACTGQVRFAGAAGTSGRTVSVACGRYLATYLHLGAVAVRRGEDIVRGERLGAVGATGRPRLLEPHLAFGIRVLDRRWAYVDPLSLLPDSERAPPPAPVPDLRGRPRLGPAPPPDRAPAPQARPRLAPAARPEPATVPRTEPRLAPTPRPASARASRAAPTLPLAAWLGLAALTGALVAVPAGRRATRRRGGHEGVSAGSAPVART